MAKTNGGNTTKLIQTILVVACAVLALALIVVSAFAYQWHDENADMKRQITTLRALADQNTITSLTNSINDMQADLLEANSTIDEYKNTIDEYEKILTENDLMPEEAE
jgi:cell division protein FtsL